MITAPPHWEFHALRKHYVLFRLALECDNLDNDALARRAAWMEAALYARWENRRGHSPGAASSVGS